MACDTDLRPLIVSYCLDPRSDAVLKVPKTLIDDWLLESLAGRSVFAAIIDDKPVYDEYSLLSAIGDQCGFDWYSMNLDALLDWLLNFEWLPPKHGYVLMMRDPDSIPEELLGELKDIARLAAQVWLAKKGIPFKLLLGQTRELSRPR